MVRPREILQRQREHFATGATADLAARQQALAALATALDRHESALLEALHADLGKSAMEAFTSELWVVRIEIAHARKHLKKWLRPQRRGVPMLAFPGSARVLREPCGAVLIIGPWNYPLQLLLTPLAGALAAGCTAVLKPSELASRTSEAIAAMIADAFDPGLVTVCEGGREVAEELLAGPFDHIFFTGSQATGEKVLAATARTLTPVTLELGGKCPALVFPGREKPESFRRGLDVIARRIAWGKYLNAGQTCVSPDYVLVDAPWRQPLIEALGRAFDSFGRQDYSRLIHRQHFERIRSYLSQGRVVYGGDADEESLKIFPTVLTDVPVDSPVLREEICGPVLPVIAGADLDEALGHVRNLPPPLAVYAFSRDREVQQRIARGTRSGGVCVNDAIVQITGPTLPFGGVGVSGMGRYRGRASFETFTRERPLLRRGLWPDFAFRYPPAKTSLETLKKALHLFGGG